MIIMVIMLLVGAAGHDLTPQAPPVPGSSPCGQDTARTFDDQAESSELAELSGLAELAGMLGDPVFDGRPSPTPPRPAVTTAASPASAGSVSASRSPAPLPDASAASGGTSKDWVGVREWVAGFLLAQRSPHTRRAYAGDLAGFLGWCVATGVAPGRAARADLDRYVRVLELVPSERTGRVLSRATVARRVATLAGFYRYAALELGWASSPAAHLARPRTGREVSLGPSRVEVAALLAAAEAESPRAAALVSLLVHTGLRIDEALSRDVSDWRAEAGHQVLRLERKGGMEGVTVLPGPVVRALRGYLGERSTGPLFATGTGRRLDQPAAWRLLRRLATAAGIEPVERVSPHALRHAFVTLALDAGASLRDVQDAAGHADPATTRAYDAARGLLDRHPAYAVDSHLAGAAAPPRPYPVPAAEAGGR